MMNLLGNFILSKLHAVLRAAALEDRNIHSIIYLVHINSSCVLNHIESRNGKKKKLTAHNHVSCLKISMLAYLSH